MDVILFAHPVFLGSESMQRFAAGLHASLINAGHRSVLVRPAPLVRSRLGGSKWAKWAGYVDQYVLFPRVVREVARASSASTLFVFCDQALGPWLPLVADRPHVIHCHDLLALQSAMGDWPENPTRWSGRIYQRYIRRGFRRGRHFISVSKHTRVELHKTLGEVPPTSEVVYNGLNPIYSPMPVEQALQVLRLAGLQPDAKRMLLHVGGSQWYKNTPGLIRLYAHYAEAAPDPLPLWLVSPPPDAKVLAELARLPTKASVRFFNGLDDPVLRALYAFARAFLFPSLAEGFGWPIAEALACGCPVLTTGEAPMTEVGGDAAYYLPRLKPGDNLDSWAAAGARQLRSVLAAGDDERLRRREAGLRWVRAFNAGNAFDAYVDIYQRVLSSQRKTPSREVGPAAASPTA